MNASFSDESPSSSDLFLEAVNATLEIEEPADAANVLLQIVTALFKVGNVDYASALLPKTLKRIRQLEDPKEKAYLLRLFLTFQCKQGLIDAAVETLPLLEDSEQRAIALKELAVAQADAGRLDDARTTADEIEDLDDYETILEAIGRRQLDEGLFFEAESTAAEIEADEPRARLLRSIAESLWFAEKTDAALRVLEHSQRLVRVIDDETARSFSFAETATILAKFQRFEEAADLLNEITDPGSKEAACCAIASFMKPEKPERANILLNLAARTAREIDDPFRRASTLCQIGVMMSRNGQATEAQAVFKETLTVIREIRNMYSRTNAMTDFAVCLAANGINESSKKIFRSARATALEIDDLSLELPCLCRITEFQAEAEFFDDAFETLQAVDELREEVPRSELANGSFDRCVAGALATFTVATAEELPEESLPLFHRGIETARKISDPQQRAVALQRLAIAAADRSDRH